MKPLAPLKAVVRPTPRVQAAAERIREGLGPRVLSLTFQSGDMICIEVGRQDLLRTAQYLRDAEGLRFDFLSSVSGVDMESHFKVVYHMHSIENRLSAQLKVKLDADAPEVESMSSVWPTANWHEREAFDMLGIRFVGHPNLKRLLLAEEFVGYPLRRDFSMRRRDCPLGGHVGKGAKRNE